MVRMLGERRDRVYQWLDIEMFSIKVVSLLETEDALLCTSCVVWTELTWIFNVIST